MTEKMTRQYIVEPKEKTGEEPATLLKAINPAKSPHEKFERVKRKNIAHGTMVNTATVALVWCSIDTPYRSLLRRLYKSPKCD